MGRSPCCSKENLNRGAWTAEEDRILTEYVSTHGEGKWRNLPIRAGLRRCGKSCRLRWLNYLRPGIKRGNITPDEEDLIIRLHKLLGNRWSLIAGRLPGRTDNEIKNYWNTNLAKKVKGQNNFNPAIISLSPSNYNVNQVDSSSHVVRPKATKCSKVLMLVNNNPLTQPLHPHYSHSSMQFQNNSANANAEAEADGATDNNPSSNQLMEPSMHNINGFLSFPSEGINELSTDLVLGDFEMRDICLSDLLTSDFNFSHMCDFSYSNINNNNTHQLLPACSDQVPLLFSDEILNEYWTQGNFGDLETAVPNNNLQSSSTRESIGQ